MHHIDVYSIFFVFVLTCSLPLVLVLCFYSFALCFDSYLSTMPRKTRAHRTTSTSSESSTRVELFKNDKCRETYDTLNCRCKIWSERAVVLMRLIRPLGPILSLGVGCLS